jgi:hypothetical protein
VDKETCFSEVVASLFCSLTRLCMYSPEEVAILSCLGGQRNVSFRGVDLLFSLLTRIRMYLPEEVAILKCSVDKGTCCSEGQQVCFLC